MQRRSFFRAGDAGYCLPTAGGDIGPLLSLRPPLLRSMHAPVTRGRAVAARNHRCVMRPDGRHRRLDRSPLQETPTACAGIGAIPLSLDRP